MLATSAAGSASRGASRARALLRAFLHGCLASACVAHSLHRRRAAEPCSSGQVPTGSHSDRGTSLSWHAGARPDGRINVPGNRLELNARMAVTLGAPVLMVVDAGVNVAF